ncbi:MAG: glucosaminidase domain-containing protein [Alistipes sp.]|jgi:hypothetical protein|nr:glucosaminidase domain-containing protein [Alistipes sp.]
MNFLKSVTLCIALSAAGALPAQNISRAEYIERYKGIAVAHQEKYGIPASIKMAQGILESANGNSRLALEGNNHFGIKCKSDWTGLTIHHDDDAAGECFRRYDSAEESWADHSEFLDNGARYQFLFELAPTDYVAWANGLKAAGYATDPSYPERLIKIIEDNRLYLLDRGERPGMDIIVAREQASEERSRAREIPSGRIDPDCFPVSVYPVDGRAIFRTPEGLFIVAQEGDTPRSLARLAGVRARRLARRNGIATDTPLAAGQSIKLQ